MRSVLHIIAALPPQPPLGGQSTHEGEKKNLTVFIGGLR